MIEHTKVSNAEHELVKKVVFSMMMTVPEQVAANVTELQRHALLPKRTLSHNTPATCCSQCTMLCHSRQENISVANEQYLFIYLFITEDVHKVHT